MTEERRATAYQSADAIGWTRGLVVTLATALVLEIYRRSALYELDLGPAVIAVLLLGAILYAGYRGGLRSALTSSAISVLYVLYAYSVPDQPFRYRAGEDTRRVIMVAVVLPVVGLVVGILRDRVTALLVHERRLRARAVAAEYRAEFLSEASRILASSLDYRETLRRVANLAVPRIADWCGIDVLENGDFHRIAVAHADPAKAEIARELARYSPGLGLPTPVPEALRTGRPLLIEEVTPEWLDGIPDLQPEYRALLKRLAVRSAMIVPLIARKHRLGVITLAVAESGRRYRPEDMTIVGELADRAALAVDNARLYEEAVVADRAKTEFLAVMSHELRTPLNAILGYADLMRMDVPVPLPEPTRQQVERIMASAHHLLELIEEVLRFSRIETGREEVRIERTDLRRLVQEAANMTAPLAEEKGLRFEVRVPDEPTPVETDPGMVRQMLLNLLSNAVKFTDRGEIRLAAEAHNGMMTIEVQDTGIGIPPEHRERIFDPFWQVERGTTRRVGGTGLGLSVTRHLARLLGGEVYVDSEVDRGSTFTVRLPTDAPERRSDPEPG